MFKNMRMLYRVIILGVKMLFAIVMASRESAISTARIVGKRHRRGFMSVPETNTITGDPKIHRLTGRHGSDELLTSAFPKKGRSDRGVRVFLV